MESEELIAQTNRASLGLQIRAKIYRKSGLELEPMSHKVLWRHATRFINLITTMTLTITRGMDDIGPQVNEWRYRSDKSLQVTRVIIHEFAKRRKPLGQTEFVQIMAGRASESTVKTVLRDGLDLALLKRIEGGYIPTPLLIDQLFERSLHLILQQPVVEFCRFVVNFHDSRENNLRLLELEERQPFTTDKNRTIQERIFSDYDGLN